MRGEKNETKITEITFLLWLFTFDTCTSTSAWALEFLVKLGCPCMTLTAIKESKILSHIGKKIHWENYLSDLSTDDEWIVVYKRHFSGRRCKRKPERMQQFWCSKRNKRYRFEWSGQNHKLTFKHLPMCSLDCFLFFSLRWMCLRLTSAKVFQQQRKTATHVWKHSGAIKTTFTNVNDVCCRFIIPNKIPEFKRPAVM